MVLLLGRNSTPPVTPSEDLLTQADFTNVGAFKMPAGAYNPDPNLNWTSGYGTAALTFRRVGGVDHLISSGYNGASAYPIFEFTIPALVTGSKVSSFNTASVYRNWGLAPYGSLIEPITNGVRQYGLWWDETDQALYWTVGPYYTEESDYPTIGKCTLNDGSGVAAPVGIWKLTGVHQKHVKGGVLRIPDSSFIAANCPGKPLCAGFGSGGTSIFGGHSIGPAFYAMPVPDTGTYASGSAIPNVELLSYPWNASGTPSAPYRARRTDDYSSKYWGTGASYGANTWTPANEERPFDPDTPSAVGIVLSIVAGTGSGQTKTVTGISGMTCTLDSPWAVVPDASSEWEFPSTWTWAPSGGVGYWTPGDAIYSGAAWIKNATKQAIVVFATWATGRQSYFHNPNGPNYESGKHMVLLYDPAELAAVAQGSKVNYTVDPYETFEFQVPWVTYPLAQDAIAESAQRHFFGGVAVTPEHNRIYVGYAHGYSSDPILPNVIAIDIAG